MTRYWAAALLPLGLLLQLPLPTNSQRFTDGIIAIPSRLGFSEPCMAAMNGSISCPSVLAKIVTTNGFLNELQTSLVCTEQCYKTLLSAREHMQQSCIETDVYAQGTATGDPAIRTIDKLIYAYNSSCVKEPDSGKYCGPMLPNLLTSNNSKENHECDKCVLDTISVKLNSPFGYDKEGAKRFGSRTSGCNASGYTIVPPKPDAVNHAKELSHSGNDHNAVPTSHPGCTNSYTTQQGDTCNSLSLARKISSFWLAYTNNLNPSCDKLPVGTSICLPKQCDVFEVKEKKSCSAIVHEVGGITRAQLSAWNPNLGSCGYGEIPNGTVICISPPGGYLPNLMKPNAISEPTRTTSSIAVGATYACLQYPVPSSCHLPGSMFPTTSLDPKSFPWVHQMMGFSEQTSTMDSAVITFTMPSAPTQDP